MIIIIVIAILIAIGLAIVIVGARSGVVKQAQRIVDQGRVTDIPRAKRILKVLSTTPADIRTKEIDTLYDKLDSMIQSAEDRNAKIQSIGFRQ